MRANLPTPCTLLEALQRLVPGASKRTLRQMLEQGRVRLNDQPCRLATKRVAPGDCIQIGSKTAPTKLKHGLKIVFEDDDLILIEKPAGLLTVATPHESERTAYAMLREYVKTPSRKNKVFIVHRLDKFVSGLLVFAKSEEIKAGLQAQFIQHSIERRYWAIVEGRVEKDRCTIRSYLAEDRSSRMHTTPDEKSGKLAITHFRIRRRFHDMTLLEITLETGRKNQIRAHLSEMGHPIAGDRAYGSKSNPLSRMGLHAFCLGFKHPKSGKLMLFKTDPPAEFQPYL